MPITFIVSFMCIINNVLSVLMSQSVNKVEYTYTYIEEELEGKDFHSKYRQSKLRRSVTEHDDVKHDDMAVVFIFINYIFEFLYHLPY